MHFYHFVNHSLVRNKNLITACEKQIVVDTYCSIDVGGRFVIGIGKHRYHADHYRLDGVDRQPTFLRAFIAVLVLARVVKNRYADVSGLGNWNQSQSGDKPIHICRCGSFLNYLIQDKQVDHNGSSMFDVLFGCQISVINFSLGGFCGYSLGNVRWALKNPPSLKNNKSKQIRLM